MSELAAAEQVETPEAAPAAAEPDSLEQIDSLLAEALGGSTTDENGNTFADEPIPEKEPEQEPERELEEPEGSPDEPLAAEEPEESSIDYDLEIPMPDGREAMTLGQMKDRVTELERTELQYQDRENDLARRQDEFAQIAAQSGVEINPQARQRMDQLMQDHLHHEHKAMIDSMPEVSDPTAFEKMKGEIMADMKEYGLEAMALQVTDHNAIRYMRDNARLRRKLREAEKLPEKIHKASKKGTKPRRATKRSTQDKMVADAMASNDDDTKQAAIDNLLRG